MHENLLIKIPREKATTVDQAMRDITHDLNLSMYSRGKLSFEPQRCAWGGHVLKEDKGISGFAQWMTDAE